MYSISEALEEFTEDRTRGAIRALMDLAPKRVSRLVDGREEQTDLGELAVGDTFVVRAGEGVATDGEITEGRSAINEAAITGERHQATVLESLTRAETVAAVRLAIRSLPPAYREAVVLCELQEMSYEAAAGIAQCPVGTIRSRLHRAKALLVSKLAATRSEG